MDFRGRYAILTDHVEILLPHKKLKLMECVAAYRPHEKELLLI
jgi:hypothetical protein